MGPDLGIANRPTKLHAAALIESHGEPRRDRRARRQAAAKIEVDAHKAKHIEVRSRGQAERDEARSHSYLGAAGKPGPAQLRTLGRLHLPTHQDTSATLAGHYAFLAEAGLGSAGVYVGQDLFSVGSFVYDPWAL